eukprot:CAMPEP_0204559144 /NCGR_PEP_ID=MMETSP0661-20131031/31688_1 /ASSEMBLY_ACC=CAM_ASM_000606 /TAXON_ID=109239 /ORGANISM="Alexandrium margalefi, Strain AMGDE01CS-322" /LENGTH=62 /DNA_ID=CAMNT_0051566347 /DNA_START=89 /DNA_END=274 /DNA_ORIENTATION=-
MKSAMRRDITLCHWPGVWPAMSDELWLMMSDEVRLSNFAKEDARAFCLCPALSHALMAELAL